MKPKTTLTLFIILVLLSGFYYIYQYKGSKARKAAKERSEKLLLFEKDSVKAILLRKPDQTIELRKEQDGLWHIVQPIATKADVSQVNNILNNLANARIERVVADSTANPSAYGLQPPKATLVLEYTNGKKDSIIIGDRNATRSYTFARVNDKPQVVLSSSTLATTAEKTLFNLRDKEVLEFEKGKVKKLTLVVKGKKYVAEKRDGKWYLTFPVERLADADEIDKILNRLDIERAEEFVKKATNLSRYGLAHPDYTIELILLPNDAKKKLLIGKKVDNNKYYVKDDSRDPVMKISKYLVDELPKNLFEMSDKHVLHFDRNAITEVTISYSDTTITIKKDSSNTWTIVEPDTFKAKSWRMSSLLGTMERLKAEEIVSNHATNLGRYGLDKPICTASVIDSLGNVQEILYWGKKAKNATSYVTNKKKEKVFRVKSYNLDSIKLHLKDLKES